jgi:glycosyltransferase involved in cell wall biosynthesis
MKISIVTPSFNQSDFLEETINSVISQDHPDLEYIIIDGGSTDRSVEIIKKYEKHLTYWISESDRGQTHAINKGFQKATGEILAYLNSDDLYLPHALSRVAGTFTMNPSIDLAYGNIQLIDEKSNYKRDIRFVPFNFQDLLYEGGCLHQTGTFWTKRIYDVLGGFDENLTFCMDYDFFVRAAARHAEFTLIPYHLSCFREHGSSKSSNLITIGDAEHELIRDAHLERPLLPISAIKAYYQAVRMLKYVKQGDTGYVIRGIMDRLKSN